jgi:hypothetical protein
LLKIELSLQIKTLDLAEPVPELAVGGQQLGADIRVSYRSKKVFAFADDCNVLTTADKENLDNLVDILDTFGEISGLVCNIQKTNILLIGAEPDNNIESPFTIAEELTILGFKIKNNDDNFRHNCLRILERVKKQIRVWSHYNLSLPGRIEISKTMLYSQINYMGCIIEFPEDILEMLEDHICKFASGTLKIAKQRVFTGIEYGGLGLFNLRNFIDAQICSWVRRCKIIDQDWKDYLLEAGAGNIYQIHSGFGLRY